jgi:hypothetical protein
MNLNSGVHAAGSYTCLPFDCLISPVLTNAQSTHLFEGKEKILDNIVHVATSHAARNHRLAPFYYSVSSEKPIIFVHQRLAPE